MKYIITLAALVALGVFAKIFSGPDARLAAGGNGLVWTGKGWEPKWNRPDPY